jgi:hypothetical protein
MRPGLFATSATNSMQQPVVSLIQKQGYAT